MLMKEKIIYDLWGVLGGGKWKGRDLQVIAFMKIALRLQRELNFRDRTAHQMLLAALTLRPSFFQ